MQIKVLRNLGRGLPPYKEGQVVTVSDTVGADLVKRDLARVIEAIPKEERTTPKIIGVPKTSKPLRAESDPVVQPIRSPFSVRVGEPKTEPTDEAGASKE